MTCKNCEDRYPACHSTCEKYKAWKEEREERKALINHNKHEEWEVSSYHRERKGCRRRVAEALEQKARRK